MSKNEQLQSIVRSSNYQYLLISKTTFLATIFGLQLALERIAELEGSKVEDESEAVCYLSLNYVNDLTDNEIERNIQEIIDNQKPGLNLI